MLRLPKLVIGAVLMLVLSGCMGAASKPAADPTVSEERTRRTSRGGSVSADFLAPNGTVSFGDADLLWGNRTEIVVMDQDVKWHRDQNQLLYPMYVATQLIANPCIWNNGAEVYFNNQRVHFDSSDQLVPNGTAKIRLKLTWDTLDFPFDELSYAYRPRDGNLTQGPMVRKSEVHEFPVFAGTWDYEGMGQTGWEFYVCVSPDESSGFSYLGRAFIGSFHIDMTLLRGEAAADPRAR